MIFKINHEKTAHPIKFTQDLIQEMLKSVLPKAQLLSYEIISGGCANLNMKINIENEPNPYLLRLYLRDKNAAFREQKLGNLLKDIVTVPQILEIGELGIYRFAITTYINGITLRDLLLSNRPHDIKSLMAEAALYLSKIKKVQFDSAGFFDKDLKIIPHDSENAHYYFIKTCLKNPIVLKYIGSKNCAKMDYYFDHYKSLISDLDEKNLVHGDFDPANILVDKIENQWKITGILDWEFAFSGSILQDVANMLRYAHHMPAIFETSFLESLQENGVILPKNWRIIIYLLNISSLLDCLIRHAPEERPNQSADILALIKHIILNLDEMHEKTN